MILTAILLFQFAFHFRGVAEGPPVPPSPAFAFDSLKQMERLAFDLVNRERSRQGLSALRWSDKLAALARSHSEEMAKFKYVDHTDREGRQVADRARDALIIGWRALGENIAYNN